MGDILAKAWVGDSLIRSAWMPMFDLLRGYTMDINNTDLAPGVLALVRGLRRAAELGPRAKARDYPTQDAIIKDGGAPGFRIEDLLIEAGLPWDLSAHWKDLCPLVEIKVETLFWRPLARANQASGGPGLSLVAIATLAVHLARLGFEIDPAPLVTAALPAIKAKRLITQHELDLLWWRRERGGMRDIQRFSAPIPTDERGVIHNLPSGYRAAAHAEGVLIASPKVGKRRWANALLCLDFDDEAMTAGLNRG
jgi:hypothetical protein